MASHTEQEIADQEPDRSINPQTGRQYWQSVTADDNGMLGGIPSCKGFSSISKIDLQGSRTFLARLGIGAKAGRQPVANALDGGAGIGRITQGLLVQIAENVDVVEPEEKFTRLLVDKPGVGHIFNVGLQDWQPPADTQYDLIWTQWCVGHLTDEQLVQFLQVCKGALRPETGIIVMKENLSTSGVDVYDPTDSSVTRQDKKFLQLISRAGLKVIRQEVQRGIPETMKLRLLPVKMYALRP
ncbi:alpha-N-methyltransferase NTM1 [Stachybotrys elegans]|uniref:Alpha N-terminal protein methyltransferase 1 n=1 Tax=Stachybotrys elegans TaxID=80388 RepID=A0A8K0SD79_9HYPO|nr:alpha-N-methyltransferase NTM1 [Stachybotrys elegans]